ncbi:MAG TPA: FG-GAP-like repeat-containing protein [Verrucomicrobiae bacterium]|jgi:hypothetical protein
MKHHSKPLWLAFTLCALLLASSAPAQPARQTVTAHIPAAARLAQAVGTMPATERLSVAIALPFRNQAALTNLLHQINDPASPNYRHYLTREQFTERFGPTEADYSALKKFASASGLRINAEHANRMLLEVNGSVEELNRVFHTTLRTYQHPTEARTFFAADTEPSLDLAVRVLSIGGLDNYELARPHLQSVALVSRANAQPNAGSGPAGTYSGNDFRAAYVPDSSLTGSGQVVGLLQFDGYTASDIAYYETQAGLPNVPLSNVLLNGASGFPNGSGGEVEVSLDIETAISMAPGLSQVIVYEAPNPSPFEVILNRMVSDNLAKQLSCSWFQPHGTANPTTDQIFQEMAVQGQSFFNASGDDDAFTGLVDFPGDTPFITQVGGTTLSTTAPGGARTSETVWNRNNGIGSGGGISTQYGIPFWQTNIDMSGNQGSTTMRNIPDVALTAENVYVRVNGQDYRVGGTSCAAPLWAGFAALANQEAAASAQPPIGFINPALDKIGSSSSYTSCFYDVTTGDNTSSRSPSKFFATVGYDLCTGWGTPAGQKLIDALANPEALHITPDTGFSSVGGMGGPFTITSQELSLTNAGTNSLNWVLVNTAPWLDASPTSGTLNPGDPATFVTVSLNSAASNLTLGTYSAPLYFTNLTSKAGIERDYSVSVISPPSITIEPADQAMLDGATATFSIQASGGLPLFYQWQLNGTNLTDGGEFAGTETTDLTITNVTPADVGTYTVVVTNIAGTTLSSNALLSIVDSVPVITIPPANETVIAGQTATFTVAAIGSKPFYYQWTYGGTNITGGTNATLILPNVQLTDAGLYSVVVSNYLGAAPISSATLNVIEVPVITAFSPASGAVGANVTITGLNFSPNATDNAVYFGAVQAVITSASATSLAVTVPVGATFSPITVTVNGLTAFADQPFMPVFPGTGEINSSSLAPIVNFGAGSGPLRVAIGDLDGDGKPDLVVASGVDGIVSVYQNISTNGVLTAGSFAPRITLSLLPSGGNSPYGLALADLDGDGKLDIIALDADNNFVSIFRNICSGPTITGDSFAARIDLPAGTVMRGVAIKDLNGDGKPEIVTANHGDNTISVFENQSTPGNISFVDRVDIDAAPGPFSVAIADVEGDGIPDLVVANNGSSTSTVSVFQNPGIVGTISAASFLPRVDFSGTSSAEGLAIGDMDGDGKLDIVVGSPTGGTVSVYRNISTPGTIDRNSFSPAVDFAGAGIVNTLSLADVDGDGRLDLTCSSQGNNAFSIFKNISAPGSFTTASLGARVDYASGSNPNGIALGDLDGDGRPDVVFGNYYDDTISIYKNIVPIIGEPIITTQPTNLTVYAGSAATFTVSASGDAPLFYQWHFNGTNDLPGATNNVLTLTNAQFTDAGNYSVTVTNARSSATSSNAMLIVNPSPSSIPVITSFNPSSGNVGVVVTLGGSNFSAVASNDLVYFGAVQTLVTSASITNLSVLVPTGATFAPITVTVNGMMAFAHQPFLPTFRGIGQFNSASLASRLDLSTGSGPIRVVIADLDGDGKPDVAAAEANSIDISIFRNISTSGSLTAGSFASPIVLSMGTTGSGANPYGLAAADLDGDGRLDLIALNASANAVSIFRNISSPGTITTNSFASRMDLPSGNVMRGLAIQDLNRDGRPEIVVANFGDNTVSIFENKSAIGNLSFGARVNFEAGTGTFSVGLADMDGDGQPDIVTVNNNSSSAAISVLRNLGLTGAISNGSFSPRIDFPASNSAEALAIGDLDGDGKLDVIAGSPTGSGILVFRNTSTSGVINSNSFAPAVKFAAAGKVNSVGLADMDGDGKLDIALVTQASNAFSIFKNISTPGTFTTSSLAARVDFSSGNDPIGVALGDLDGDGRPDVVFGNFYDNTLSVYQNVVPIGIPPVITTQPTNLVVSVGSSATFSVTATGTAPLRYRWHMNGTNILSATNSTLVLTNVYATNAGVYYVTVTNLYGSTDSSNATLTVTGFDHFAWNPIPSPRFANAPFAVTILAQDTTNGTFTNFVGTAMLSSTNGVMISPQVSGDFVGGVWNGTLTVPQVVSGLVLQVNDGAGHIGMANAIDVVNPPSVGMLNFGSSLLISWPVSSSNFVLESSGSLLSGTWRPVPGSPLQFNGQNLQSVPQYGTNQYFRLRFLGP